MFPEFHEDDSKTGGNASISGDLLHCWRHNISHNAFTFLAVKAGLYTCHDAGRKFKGHRFGCTRTPDNVYNVWLYAKQNGIIPIDDPIPSKALEYAAIVQFKLCSKSDLTDGWKLPTEGYNKVIEALEKEGIETGRKPLTVKKETGRQLSNQERELLTAAFKKMLLSDDDNAKEKNGVGFNKFDSEAIHKEMDGKTEIPAETLIKFAPKLKKYKKQLAVFGIDTADIEGIIKEYNKKPKTVESENVKVPFDSVAKEIMDNYHIFTTTDNKQMFLYQDGVYKNEGTEAILSTKIRDIHDQLYAEYWLSINQGSTLEHIPKATTKYISEVFAYIQDYTYKSRDEIDNEAVRYLNFQNGIFDIEKWKLKKHTPDYLSVCQIPRIYDKKATCPQIEKFITETIDPNDEDFVFEWFGYNLTTDVSYESSLFVYGPQGTGKSLLLSLLNSFVGCNNCSAETLQNLEVKPSRVANLYGKRANICSEIPSTQIHQNEMFKKLTSGKDTVTGEHKYVRAFDFVNKAKFTFSGNKLPEEPKDPAWFARIKLISMRNIFRGTNKDDKKLIHKLILEEELSGLLNLALKGLKRLYDNDKFSYYKTFEETEREYILYSNPVEAFVSECTVISNTDTEKDILYLEYVGWSMNKKLERLSKIEFARKIKKMGYTDYRANVPGSYCLKKIDYWCNIKVQSLLVGRDVGRDVKHRSRPNQNSQLLSNNRSNSSVGQDLSLCKSILENNAIKYENNENNENIEVTYEKSERSRPNLGFFVIGHTDPVGRDVGRDLVLETESTDFCENEENEGNNVKNIAVKTSIEETTEVPAKSNLIVTAEEMAKAWEEEGI
jgi:P4 family phage/plasmid primase-like protien